MNQPSTVSIVVVGASGQGKSSLINSILSQEQAMVGDDLDGVTKNISAYKTILNTANLELILYDLPGFGDVDVNVETLAEQWNTILYDKQIDLIFFCHQISNSRMDMITRKGLNLMIQSLKNPILEKSFVIVITQIDLMPDQEIDKFKNQFLQKQLIPKLKNLVNATEITKFIYTSTKHQKETIKSVQKLCLDYLNDKKILRVGLLGEQQLGKTLFAQIISGNSCDTKQQQLITNYLTPYQHQGMQVEFINIQFKRELTQQAFEKEWFQVNRSNKLNLLFIFIQQNDENMDIISRNEFQKYQPILEQKQLHQSYCIVIEPSNIQEGIYKKQKKIQDYLSTINIIIFEKNQFILVYTQLEQKNIKKRFEQCIDSFENARQQFKNTKFDTMSTKSIKQEKESSQKESGGHCISLNSQILTNQGYIKISRLIEGQIILVIQNKLIKTDRIIGFIHWSSKQQTQFVKIIFQNKTYITLTPKHLLKLYQSSFIQAQYVKKGDFIERYNGKELYSDQVSEIQHLSEYGFTCPLSQSGELIINGCIVSCYSDCSQKVGDIFTWPIRNLSFIRYLFKQNEHSEEIHPYFKLLSSINRYIKITRLDE